MASKKISAVSRKTARPATPVASTPVRNSAVPPKVTAAPTPKPAITHDIIAARAYEIYLSGSGGSELDNWMRAEAELRG